MIKKHLEKNGKAILLSLVNEFFSELNSIESFNADTIENTFKSFIERKEIGWELYSRV